MVGAVTIKGKEYLIHYGMILAEKFSALCVEVKDNEVVIRNPSNAQILTCIIYNGHENWCEVNDKPLNLKRSEVASFIEESHLSKDEKALGEFLKIQTEFSESQFIADLVKAGKEVQDKKKEKMSQPSSENLPSENLALNPGSTTD